MNDTINKLTRNLNASIAKLKAELICQVLEIPYSPFMSISEAYSHIKRGTESQRQICKAIQEAKIKIELDKETGLLHVGLNIEGIGGLNELE